MTMQIFQVGGHVRDREIERIHSVSIETNDMDYVVVGATQMDFIENYPTAKLIEGKEFPVYKHNGDDYAFARTEQSTGPGHTDFEITCDPNVSLLDDLSRRDVTINAMAYEDGGILIDPHGGLQDIKDKTLNIICEDEFITDPLRVFRVARLAAKLHFDVSTETMEAMRKCAPKLKYLSVERVFMEMSKALATDNPRVFFDVLYEADCLHQFFPELQELKGVSPGSVKHDHEEDAYDHCMQALQRCARNNNNECLRFAVVCHDFGKAKTPRESHPKHHCHDKLGLGPVRTLCDRLRVPNSYRTAAMTFCKEHMRMHKLLVMKPGKSCRSLLSLEKGFPLGVAGFVCCLHSDGSTLDECRAMVHLTKEIKKVRLPLRYQNQGAKSGLQLLQLQTKAYKKAKAKYLSLGMETERFLGITKGE
ncbi:MAG: hypothetical protein KAS32_25310 [Candidatus Peribacteraceae bacterium]|nr:hypothetical protein [Candidatus Peribacteraceae bacterium]